MIKKDTSQGLVRAWRKKHLKRTLLSVVMLIAVFGVVFGVKAATVGNTKGFLWGGTDDGAGAPIPAGVGWVSMSSKSCDANDNGMLDAACGGDDASTPANVDYGVTIPGADGDLSGYGWSGNLGWVAFENGAGSYLSGCPNGGSCNARRVGNELQGWARFAGIADAMAAGNAGGYEGWISLKDTTGANRYGVTINPVTGNFCDPAAPTTVGGKCYAWSSEFGFIRFNEAGIDTPAISSFTVNGVEAPGTANVELTAGMGFAQNVNIAWTVSNAASCTASNGWAGNKNKDGGAETVALSSPAVTFRLTCTNGSTEVFKEVSVTTMCREHSCTLGSSVGAGGASCNEAPKFAVASYEAGCPVQDCSADDQCVYNPSFGNWKEVMP